MTNKARSNNFKLKDFAYLDFERIRSYSAQIFDGILETTSNSSKTGVSGKIEGEKKINLLVAGGRVNANIGGEYSHTSNETKSQHHMIYVKFEKALEDGKKMVSINTFNDSLDLLFIKFKCKIQIINYPSLLERFNKLLGVIDIINKVQENETKKKENYNTLNKNEKNRIDKEIKIKKTNIGDPKEIKILLDGLCKIYDNGSRLNIILEDKIFASCQLNDSLFQYNQSTLLTGSESILDEEWTVVCQKVNKSSSDPQSFTNLNPLDLAVMQFNDVFKQLNKLINTQDALEIIPLAIYREL